MNNEISGETPFATNTYINRTVYGTDDGYPITSNCFDGTNTILVTQSGKFIYATNDSANTRYDFDTSFNNTPVQTNLPTVYTSCFNRRFVVLGGTGGSVITYNGLYPGVPPSWYSTNAANLFTTVYGIASNSVYGHTYCPNTICLNAGEKVSVVSPSDCNPSIASGVAISMDLVPPI